MLWVGRDLVEFAYNAGSHIVGRPVYSGLL